MRKDFTTLELRAIVAILLLCIIGAVTVSLRLPQIMVCILAIPMILKQVKFEEVEFDDTKEADSL